MCDQTEHFLVGFILGIILICTINLTVWLLWDEIKELL